MISNPPLVLLRFYIFYFKRSLFFVKKFPMNSFLDCKLTKLANMDMMEQVIDPARVYMKDAIR